MRILLLVVLTFNIFLLSWCGTRQDVSVESIKTLIQQWERAKADEQIDIGLIETPDSTALLIQKIIVLNEQKKYDAIIPLWLKLSSAGQQEIAELYTRALIRTGKVESALSLITQQLEKATQDAPWHELQGEAYYLQWAYDKAIASYDAALRIEPNRQTAIANKWIALADNGQLQESLLLLDQALQQNPENALLRYNKWTVLSNLGYQQRVTIWTWAFSYYADALRHFEKAYKLDPNDQNTLIWLGITYLDLGEFHKAHKAFDVTLSNNKNAYDALYYKGKTYVAEGNLREGKKTFQQLIELNPEYTLAQQEIIAIDKEKVDIQ
jgi:tetratricopeptide (TPR) repeat protein